MRVVIAKLLLLVALLFMPLGMAPPSAAMTQHDMAAAMPMGHCPEGPSKHHMNGGMAECTMACAAALPAVVAVQSEQVLAESRPATPAIEHRLHGLHPETATPPPRHA